MKYSLKGMAAADASDLIVFFSRFQFIFKSWQHLKKHMVKLAKSVIISQTVVRTE